MKNISVSICSKSALDITFPSSIKLASSIVLLTTGGDISTDDISIDDVSLLKADMCDVADIGDVA